MVEAAKWPLTLDIQSVQMQFSLMLSICFLIWSNNKNISLKPLKWKKDKIKEDIQFWLLAFAFCGWTKLEKANQTMKVDLWPFHFIQARDLNHQIYSFLNVKDITQCFPCYTDRVWYVLTHFPDMSVVCQSAMTAEPWYNSISSLSGCSTSVNAGVFNTSPRALLSYRI